MTRSRSLLALFALAAVIGPGCAPDEGNTPKLRKGTPSVRSEATDPVEDASAPPPDMSATPDAGTSPPASVEVYVSDLDVTSTNGFGPIEKDMSNGEDAPNDGKTLTLGGTTYTKGFGVHASSEITVPLGGGYKTFLAEVGIDDEVADQGTVVFQVLVDGQIAFDSGIMTGASDTKAVSVDVSGKQELKLVVSNGGDDDSFDHADWAAARLVK